MSKNMSTAPLDYISQRDYLTTLSTKLEERRNLLNDLGIDLPTDMTLHCESCNHALATILARKQPYPPELYQVFPLWNSKYFPDSGSDVAQANEARSLYKQGNGLQYLADLYDLPIEYIVEYIHTNNE